jgi:hypothetical protein
MWEIDAGMKALF